MSEKVTFLRSTAFENLVVAAFLFVLCYMVQDIESGGQRGAVEFGGGIALLLPPVIE